MKRSVKYIIAGPDENYNHKFKKILDVIQGLDYGGSFTSFKEWNNYVGEASLDIAFIRVGEVGMNAYELHREIRERNPFSKVIFTSDHEEYAIEAFDCEVDGFLLDPFDEEKIKNLVLRILGFEKT